MTTGYRDREHRDRDHRDREHRDKHYRDMDYDDSNRRDRDHRDHESRIAFRSVHGRRESCDAGQLHRDAEDVRHVPRRSGSTRALSRSRDRSHLALSRSPHGNGRDLGPSASNDLVSGQSSGGKHHDGLR